MKEMGLADFDAASQEEREKLSADQLLALAEAAEQKEHDEKWCSERIAAELIQARAELKNLRELSFDAIGRHLQQLQELIQSRVPQARMLGRVEDALSSWSAVNGAVGAGEETLGQMTDAFTRDEERVTEETVGRLEAASGTLAELNKRLEAERDSLVELASRVTFWASENVDLVGWNFADDVGSLSRGVHDRLMEAGDAMSRLAARWEALASEVNETVERYGSDQKA